MPNPCIGFCFEVWHRILPFTRCVASLRCIHTLSPCMELLRLITWSIDWTPNTSTKALLCNHREFPVNILFFFMVEPLMNYHVSYNLSFLSSLQFFTDLILARHARKLLSSFRLRDLGRFSAHLDFDLTSWFIKERYDVLCFLTKTQQIFRVSFCCTCRLSMRMMSYF